MNINFEQVLTRSFQRKAGSHYRCIYRFCQEGLPLVLPFVTKQKLSLSLNMMKTFLKEKSIKIPRPQSDHEDPNDPPDISEQGNEETQSKEESLIHDPEVIEKLSYLEQGGCIVLLDDTDSLKFGLPLSSESIGTNYVLFSLISCFSWVDISNAFCSFCMVDISVYA